MKNNNLQGDLTDIPAKIEALVFTILPVSGPGLNKLEFSSTHACIMIAKNATKNQRNSQSRAELQ